MRGEVQVVGRPPAVAGLFYPDEPEVLRSVLRDCLARAASPQAAAPKALISPHAGYTYSGPVAGSAYRALGEVTKTIKRVVLVGPSHFVPFAGLAIPRVDAFETPLGIVPIDDVARHEILRVPHVMSADAPHAREHSLEVQLPFLQLLLSEFRVLPVVVGDATAEEVSAALECVWGNADTLIIVSSDLSHYLEYAATRRIDAATAEEILNCSTALSGKQACGHVCINGLMHAARQRRLRVELLDLRNSGDTTAERARVVGYGAFALYERHGAGSNPS
jgi:AmmeMemoRadiSam system protein B